MKTITGTAAGFPSRDPVTSESHYKCEPCWVMRSSGSSIRPNSTGLEEALVGWSSGWRSWVIAVIKRTRATAIITITIGIIITAIYCRRRRFADPVNSQDLPRQRTSEVSVSNSSRRAVGTDLHLVYTTADARALNEVNTSRHAHAPCRSSSSSSIIWHRWQHRLLSLSRPRACYVGVRATD